MPKLKKQNPMYPAMKKGLLAMGLRKRPMFSKHNKPKPTIPQMHPNIKGSGASNYRRVGQPIVKVTKRAPVIIKVEPISHGLRLDPVLGLVPRVRRRITELPGRILETKTIYRVRKNSKKGGSGKGGGGQNLGKGARKTGTSASRRIAARIGGTRGARPSKEVRKKKKK